MVAMAARRPSCPVPLIGSRAATVSADAADVAADARSVGGNASTDGTPDTALAQITGLAERYGVDEVMLHPVAGSRESDPLDRAPTRESTLRLLAEALV